MHTRTHSCTNAHAHALTHARARTHTHTLDAVLLLLDFFRAGFGILEPTTTYGYHQWEALQLIFCRSQAGKHLHAHTHTRARAHAHTHARAHAHARTRAHTDTREA